MVKSEATLTTVSVITVVLVILHVADDIARQLEPGKLADLAIVGTVATVWLYGTLVLSGRLSGYVIMVLGSLIGLLIPVIHMKGPGIGANISRSDGGFFFVATLLALGVGAAMTLILSLRGLWALRRG